MKKGFLLITSILLVTFVHSQTLIGVRGGVALSKFKLNDYLYQRWGVEQGVGLAGGLFADINLFGSSFSLQPEINYLQKNTKWTSRDNYPFGYFVNNGNGRPYFINDNGVDKYPFAYGDDGSFDDDKHLGIRAKQDLKMTYFDIPILIKYKFRGRSSQFYINAGPRFGLGGTAKSVRSFFYQGKWLDKKLVNPIDGDPLDPDIQTLILKNIGFNTTTESNPLEFGSSTSSEFTKVDIGLALGLGYTLEIEDVGFFSLDARLNTGSNIFNNSKKIDFSNDLVRPRKEDSAKYSTWMLTLSYAYPLGGF